MINKVRIKAKTKMKHRRSLSFRTSKQQGFTLIELLVVVSILASLAGLASVAMDGYQQDAEEKITRVEMQRIANAIRKFKIDTGYWPKTGLFSYSSSFTPLSLESNYDNYYGNAIDFSWLFYPPTKHIAGKEYSGGTWTDNNEKISEWQIENSIGWHGPYIDIPAAKEIVAGTNCQDFTNTEMTALLSEPSGYPTKMKRRSIGITDRFERDWRRTDSNNYCVTTRDEKNYNQYAPDHISGSPYLYEVFNSTPFPTVCSGSTRCIVLRSLGKKNINSDDIYFVLVDE